MLALRRRDGAHVLEVLLEQGGDLGAIQVVHFDLHDLAFGGKSAGNAP